MCGLCVDPANAAFHVEHHTVIKFDPASDVMDFGDEYPLVSVSMTHSDQSGIALYFCAPESIDRLITALSHARDRMSAEEILRRHKEGAPS